jgi:Flp pilus assembly protein TadD
MSLSHVGARATAVIAMGALAVASASLVLNSAAYQDWRLARLDTPALQSELQSRGESSRLLYYLGRSLNRQKRCAEADGYLRQGVGLEPDSPRLREEWARALLGSGKTTAAFGELREFAGTHPNLAQAHLILGKFYYTQRSMKRAAEEFERAIALEPDSAQAYLNLAGARDDLRESEAAWKAASRAAELQPNSAEAHLILASLAARTRRPPGKVRAEFERALDLAPRNAVAHEEYARWLLQSTPAPDGSKLAEQHAHQAITLGLDDPAAFLTQGRAMTYTGNYAGAVTPLRHATDAMPTDPAPPLALAQAYRSLGQSQEAAQWQQEYARRQTAMTEKQNLLQAVTVAPNDPRPKERLAHWLGRHGDVEGCAHNHSMAMRKPLDSPQVLVAVARDLLAGGYADLALPLARNAADFAGRNPEAHEVLGDTLLQTRRVSEAAEEYNLAIKLEPSRGDRLIGRLRDFVAAHRREPSLQSMQIRTLTTAPASKENQSEINSKIR